MASLARRTLDLLSSFIELFLAGIFLLVLFFFRYRKCRSRRDVIGNTHVSWIEDAEKRIRWSIFLSYLFHCFYKKRKKTVAQNKQGESRISITWAFRPLRMFPVSSDVDDDKFRSLLSRGPTNDHRECIDRFSFCSTHLPTRLSLTFQTVN